MSGVGVGEEEGVEAGDAGVLVEDGGDGGLVVAGVAGVDEPLFAGAGGDEGARAAAWEVDDGDLAGWADDGAAGEVEVADGWG